MISYEKALNIINKTKLEIANERISIKNSLNRVCAIDIFSTSKYPSADNAAFDGFAIISKETNSLNKKKNKKFVILKTIAAGDNPSLKKIKKNTTVEIMTGGIIPKPFDSIIPIERVKYYPSKKNPTHIIIDEKVKKFSHVRFNASDYKIKDLIIKKGEVIQPKHIMAFATLGIKKLLVKKKPKIIFFSTGNELVENNRNKKLPPWKIRSSNNHYLTSLEKFIHCKVIDGGIIRDDEQNKLKQIFKKIFKSDINIILTSGAVSVGKFDFIPKIIENYKIQNRFKNVSIRPGKPIMFCKFKNKPKVFFGLPGNPISSAACFRFFVYPLIRNILGMSKEVKFKAMLNTHFLKKKRFTRFLKGKAATNEKGKYQLKILRGQESFKIKSFVMSNVWAIFKSGKEKFNKGELIDCLPLNPPN